MLEIEGRLDGCINPLGVITSLGSVEAKTWECFQNILHGINHGRILILQEQKREGNLQDGFIPQECCFTR